MLAFLYYRRVLSAFLINEDCRLYCRSTTKAIQLSQNQWSPWTHNYYGLPLPLTTMDIQLSDYHRTPLTTTTTGHGHTTNTDYHAPPWTHNHHRLPCTTMDTQPPRTTIHHHGHTTTTEYHSFHFSFCECCAAVYLYLVYMYMFKYISISRPVWMGWDAV